jgi:dTDP-4-amino-4,6-dideoxygalactose transaminase
MLVGTHASTRSTPRFCGRSYRTSKGGSQDVEQQRLATIHSSRRPLAKPDRLHTYNQYTLRVAADRDALVKHLKDNGIGCEIYYPLPLHLQECVANRGYRTGDFPVSEEASKSVVSLPMYAEITIEQQRRVIEVCAAFVAGRVRKAA